MSAYTFLDCGVVSFLCFTAEEIPPTLLASVWRACGERVASVWRACGELVASLASPLSARSERAVTCTHAVMCTHALREESGPRTVFEVCVWGGGCCAQGPAHAKHSRGSKVASRRIMM
jgi:hypothetical protein